ncbi:MAG: M23 family metallopeptidase [Saprospiraceae bacterium]|nr:M23 family metallopeptidase [Saprospiraceae bacterium]
MRRTHILFFTFLLIIGCTEEIVPEIYQPRNDHDRYATMLKDGGLAETALGREWLDASTQALEQTLAIEVPHRQSLYFSEQETSARGFRFDVRRGEQINISLKPGEDHQVSEELNLFIDLFRNLDESTTLVEVASADHKTMELVFEPRKDATYLLRIQPELLRGGNFELFIERGPLLGFPVLGGKNYDIGSFFGDPRDGGRRRHHGVDIFAKRHTPIIAPCSGRVRFAGTKGLGGKVVWMRNAEKQLTLYFAHLHTILAEDDDWIEEGDTLGTVGNTGNARTTPPHLHFGIYANGPIDPYPFVAHQKKKAKKPAENLALGNHYRTRRQSNFVQHDGEIIALPRHEWLDVWGADHRFLYAALADGTLGTIPISNAEEISTPLSSSRIAHNFSPMRSGIQPYSPILPASDLEEARVLALHGKEHYLLETSDGLRGWSIASP